MTASEIIDLLGGTSAVANEIGAPISTVHSWRNAKTAIPAWRQPALLALALKLGKPLSATDFPERQAA